MSCVVQHHMCVVAQCCCGENQAHGCGQVHGWWKSPQAGLAAGLSSIVLVCQLDARKMLVSTQAGGCLVLCLVGKVSWCSCLDHAWRLGQGGCHPAVEVCCARPGNIGLVSMLGWWQPLCAGVLNGGDPYRLHGSCK
jgi:hypothetical protein